MKLERILDNVNSLEKNAFLKVVDNIISGSPKNADKIDKILSENEKDLKSVDNINIVQVFNLVQEEFIEIVKSEFVNITTQLDILIDILIRDGNNILKQSLFNKLYLEEINDIIERSNALKNNIESNQKEERIRDYQIYRACVRTAYLNDEENNREPRITDDELSILLTLSRELGLSQEDIKLINYIVVPPQKQEISDVITFLRNVGVIFYSRKNDEIYVADEIVRLLRKFRGKDIADKYYRRVLKTFREPLVNQVCRKHNINIKDEVFETKVKMIIKEGIPFSYLLLNDIHKDGTTLTDKKKFINELWEKGLKIETPLHGLTAEDKIENLISYFEEIEKDEKVGISIEGYEKLLVELIQVIPSIKNVIQKEFEMPIDFQLNSQKLLDYNIKPRDVLDIVPVDDLKQFVTVKEIKSRGDLVLNILDAYKDSENLYIENYEYLGYRNLQALKENGIAIKESEIGLKFESITKLIFEKLGFNVDEKLKSKLNTKRNKIDIVLNIGNNNLIIVECKTIKDSGYNKFSAVSRQIKSYVDLAKKNGYDVVKSLLIAPEFSDDFVNECGLEFEINLSLLTACSVVNIYKGFKESKHKKFPFQLLMKDVLIKEDRILKAINK